MNDVSVNPVGFRLKAFEADWILPLKALVASTDSPWGHLESGGDPASTSLAKLALALLFEARAWVVTGSRAGYFPDASEYQLDLGGRELGAFPPSLLDPVPRPDVPISKLDTCEFALALSRALDDLTPDRREFLRLYYFGAPTEWSAHVANALKVAETLARQPQLMLSVDEADAVAWCLEGTESEISRVGLPSDWRSQDLPPVATRAKDLTKVHVAFADAALVVADSLHPRARPLLASDLDPKVETPSSNQVGSSPPRAPSFPVGGPTTASWREHALTRARELRAVTDWVRLTEDPDDRIPAIQIAVQGIYDHLDAARDAAEGTPGKKLRWPMRAKLSLGGASVERANSNLDAAEGEVLRLASRDYVRGQMNNLLAHVRGHLPADDARRTRIEEIAARGDHALTDVERDAVVAAVRIASIESRREITRVRSFRNVLFVTAAVLAFAVAGLVTLGATNPGVVPLCFNPEENEIVCPTSVGPVFETLPPEPAEPPSQVAIDAAVRRAAASWDIPVAALIGLIAAAVAAAASLRNVKGTSTPYTLPIALAILKLPTGALTAFLGLLLMRGEFVPGLSALDSPAQILAWAILFGYAQQLLTRLVDRKAQDVLDEVGKADQPPVKSPANATPAPAVPTDFATQT